MLADVPVGAFLSGGIDSSTVVALMQQASSRPVRTFSIGFTEPAYNEAEYARHVAQHLGTEHIEHYVTPREAQEVIPHLPAMFDEPFGDSSQIPTFLVCRLARQQVTVSLSGDGGDELFGGYTRYERTARVWRTLRRLPAPVRAGLAGLVRAGAPLGPPLVRRKLTTLAGLLSLRTLPDVYARLHSHWKRPAELVGLDQLPECQFTDVRSWSSRREPLDQLGLIDAVTYLPDDILVKVDRASMAVSLEARVPLLDHRVVEFAACVPAALKVRDARTKWILRQVVERHVPRRLLDRPKVGFGVPLGEWLRGPLRDWAAALLEPRRLRQEGYLAPEPITTAWEEHVHGRREWSYELWDVLMFQAWLEAN
jgi:asparagine synthase (glutamine-hydrolysing)